jgi:SPP1 gp7 family putative phage head morphogenesis protein
MRKAIVSALWSLLPGLLESVRARGDSSERLDAGEVGRGRAAVESAQAHFASGFRSMSQTATRIGQRTSDFQKAQLQRQLTAAVGVEVPMADPKLGPRLERFTEENVRLIKSIPSKYFSEIEKLVVEGVSSGRRWENLAEDIEERFSVAESSARLVARDQVGKFYGEVAKARQAELGITSYVWRTMNDERVRPEHAEREGERFEWSDPPEDGNPGHAINCRCFAEPDLSAVLDEL